MAKKKILLSGAGGSLFPYLFDKLAAYDAYFTDSNPLVKKIYPKQNIIIAPKVSDASFEPFMSDILNDLEIEYYIPLIDEEIPIAHRLSAQNKKIKLISPTLEFCSLCLNKTALMRRLEDLSISVVKTFKPSDINDETKYPIFIKPICGRGSRGIQKIDSKKQLNAYLELSEYKIDELMAQEFLDGDEYTVSVTVNSKNKLLAIVPKLVLQKKGITQNAITVKSDKIEKLAKDIVEKLNPCGSFNIQLKLTEKASVFEINPRFSTTTILTIEAGIDEIALSIEQYEDDKAKFISDFKQGLGLYRTPWSYFYE